MLVRLVPVVSLLWATLSFAQAQEQKASISKGEDSSYQLVWSDEFNYQGAPDPNKWTYERGFVRNQELQWYQPENARCENGTLLIEARRERKQNPRYTPGSNNWAQSREYAEYTSASVTTRGLHSWLYGRFEMRARIDTRPGLWPAFWTLGVQGRWPAGGEIDIMEYYKGILLANVAWGSKQPWIAKWDNSKKPITEFGDPDWSRKFHVWRMDWDDTSIKLYVDDVLLNSTDLKDTVNEDLEAKDSQVRNSALGDPKNPFHQPHYIILNLALGGTSGGDPSGTEFPARFEVDYVRIYQRPAPAKAAQETPRQAQ
jgi:beta-glucanase (GH16 family)